MQLFSETQELLVGARLSIYLKSKWQKKIRASQVTEFYPACFKWPYNKMIFPQPLVKRSDNTIANPFVAPWLE